MAEFARSTGDGASVIALGYPGIVGNEYLARAISRGGIIAWLNPRDPRGAGAWGAGVVRGCAGWTVPVPVSSQPTLAQTVAETVRWICARQQTPLILSADSVPRHRGRIDSHCRMEWAVFSGMKIVLLASFHEADFDRLPRR